MDEPSVKDTKEQNTMKRDSKAKSLISSLGKYLAGILGSGVKTLVSFFVFLLILSFIGGTFSGSLGEDHFREQTLSGEGEDKIVVVSLQGIILNQVEVLGAGAEAITPEKVARILKSLQKDEKVKAVILDIESPGGSAVASDRIFESIENFKKDSHKPIVSLMGDTVASGGYYIAAATDKIIANPSTLTGSIGVLASTYKVRELLDKIGIKAEVYKKGTYKDILSSTRETTDEERTIIDSILEDAYQQFLNRVASGRKLDDARVRTLANGRIYSGKQAKEAGLVDELGNLEKAVSMSKELSKTPKAKVIRIETSNLFNQLFSSFSLGSILTFFKPLSSPKVWYLME